MNGSRLIRQDAAMVLKTFAAAAGLVLVLFGGIVLVGGLGGISLNQIIPGLHLSESHLQALPPEPLPAPGAPAAVVSTSIPAISPVGASKTPASAPAPRATATPASTPAPVSTPSQVPMAQPSLQPSPSSSPLPEPAPDPVSSPPSGIVGLLENVLGH